MSFSPSRVIGDSGQHRDIEFSEIQVLRTHIRRVPDREGIDCPYAQPPAAFVTSKERPSRSAARSMDTLGYNPLVAVPIALAGDAADMVKLHNARSAPSKG